MNKLRIGVIGAGSMGSNHLKYISNTEKAILSCVCDTDKDRADFAVKKYKIKSFCNYKDLLNSNLVDAVLIATPHYSHTPITIDAFEAGLHVLTEKPIAAHIADAEKMIDAHKAHPHLKWGAMFQQRIMKIHQKLKKILDSGEFGTIQRINYTITDWFRAQCYYDSSSWRATWHGEGGGVLLNQSVHQLDLLQWFFNMPNKIKAFCGLGKYHKIEVEDEVTAYFEYDNGATGVLIISSGEIPGVNRLEIVADKGKIILEENKITTIKHITSTSKFIQNSTDGYATPESEKNEHYFPKEEFSLHQKTIENFTDSIINNVPLTARGEDGVNSLMLANSILYSSLTGKTIELPLDSILYNDELKKLVGNSKFKKNLDTNWNFRDFKPPYA
jgi:predicted dehydrogenase